MASDYIQIQPTLNLLSSRFRKRQGNSLDKCEISCEFKSEQDMKHDTYQLPISLKVVNSWINVIIKGEI